MFLHISLVGPDTFLKGAGVLFLFFFFRRKKKVRESRRKEQKEERRQSVFTLYELLNKFKIHPLATDGYDPVRKFDSTEFAGLRRGLSSLRRGGACSSRYEAMVRPHVWVWINLNFLCRGRCLDAPFVFGQPMVAPTL